MESTLEEEKELFALKSLEDKLVTALKKKDSRVLCERLFEKGVIGREVQHKFSSLDQVHLKEELKVRYLVQHIYDAVKANKLVYHSFVDVLTEIDEGVVSELNKELHEHELWEVLKDSQVGTSEALVGSKRPRACIGEVGLCESDVPLLTELLANGAHRAYQLGLSLKLKEVQIENCFKDQHDYKVILSRVIREVIRSEVGCTLNSLKTALKSNLVALPNIVSGLEEKFTNDVRKSVYKKQRLSFESLSVKYRSGDITITRGKSALLCFKVSSFQVSYEWKKNMQPLPEGDIYSSTHSPVLFINGEGSDIEGEYECVVIKYGHYQCTEKAKLSIPESKFKMNFSSFYSVKKEIPKDTWPPVGADKYINLALVSKRKELSEDSSYAVPGDIDDRIVGKLKVEFEEEFCQYESGALILLEGRPGSGKTTLMHKMARDWSLGKSILKNAEIVILVPIRLFVLYSQDIALSNLLERYITNSGERNELLAHIERENGKGICFLIDGLDEYDHHDNLDTYIMRIIIKEVLPLSMVVVASRPVGTALVRTYSTRRVEVLGFKRNQISEYISSYFYKESNKAIDLLSYLKSHVNVHRLCYLPVHAAMICYLYDKQGDKIPQTETKIYEAFTLFSIVRKRKLRQHPKSLKTLTDDEKSYFSNICKLAFDMIVQSKQVMLQSKTDFPLIPSGSDKSSLGLVTIDSTAELFDIEDLYAFLHLTFQEYLAAFYLSQLDSESEAIMKTKELKVNLRMVWKFYSGIVQFDQDSLILKSLMSDSKTDTLYKVQCAFESQQQIACNTLLELSEEPNSLCFLKNNFIPTDFLAMSYIIETSHHVTKLLFKMCSLDSEGIDLFLDEVSIGKLDNIKYFGFNKKDCTVSEFRTIFKILSKIQHSVETLDLQSVDISKPGILKLLRYSTLSKSSRLRYFYYDCYKLSSLRDYLRCVLLLSEICCGAVAYNRFFEMLSYCSSPIDLMPKTNMELFLRCRKLVLISCGITDETLSELINIFNHFVNVDTIHLDFNKLTFENIVLPSGVDGVFSKICHFSAQYNSIQDSGAIELAKALESSAALEKLNLQGNLITEKGVKMLRKNFKKYNKFHLHVSGCGNKILDRQMADELCAIAFISNKRENIETTFRCLSYVEEFSLSDFINSSNDECLKYLKYCFSLKEIKLENCLSSNGVTALVESIKNCTNLQTLDLYSNNIGSNGAVALGEGLKSCTNLQKLYLNSNNIGSNGAVALGEGLKSCTNLQALGLSFNSIGSNGAVALGEGLKSCTNLQTLYLNSSNICSNGAVALGEGLKSCTNLQTLDLDSNNIGTNGAVALGEGLKSCTNLQKLYLNSNNIGSNGAVALGEGLKSCTNLQTLGLNSNSIGSNGAVALGEGLKSCTNLQALGLNSNNIGSNGAVALGEGLKSCTNLQTLGLSSNSIGSNGAVALGEGLKSCTNLQALGLNSSNICSNGAVALGEGLKSCTNLQTLYLNSSNICSNGAVALGEGLKSCTNLQTLDLDSNNIGTNGAVALGEGLKSCTNLQTLGLSSNSIGSNGAVALGEGLKSCTNLQTLYLNSNNIGSDGAAALAESLKSCTNLQALGLSSNSIGSNGAVALGEGLKSCTNLQTLDLDSNNIGTNGAVALGEGLKICTNLQKLYLTSNNIGSNGAVALGEGLKNCTNLQTLGLSSNSIGSDGAAALAESLKSCTNLQELGLSSNSIGSKGAVALGEGLKSCTNLQTLYLDSNNIGSNGAVALGEGLKSCTNLQTLGLNSNCIGSDGAAALAKSLKSCTNLQTLGLSSNSIGSNGAVALGEGLKSCTNLQTLYLKSSSIGSDGAAALAESLKSCTNLQALGLSSNSIGSNGAVALGEGLKSCTNLQKLYLNSNSIGSNGAVALGEGLKSCTNLQALGLSSNSIGSDGAAALAESLKSCTNLQALGLSSNSIGSNGAVALGEGLKSCTNLQKLYLNSNNISSNGAVALGEGLKSCTNLQTLDLDSNNIGSDGAAAIAESLKSCTNLQALGLSSNSIGSNGAVALGEGLKSCTNLQTLDLNSNSIGSNGAVALGEGLKSCTNLQTLGLSSNSIGSN